MNSGRRWADFSILDTWSITDLGCAGLVFFSVCQFTTGQLNMFAPTLAPLVVFIPVGLVLLVRDAVGGHGPSRLALVFAVSGLVSALTSEAPYASLFGSLFRHTSWLVFAGGLAVYAVGRRVTENGAKLVAGVFIFAICLSGAVAVLEVFVAPESGAYRLMGGRPRGLTFHPITLGQFAAGAGAVGCHRICRRGDMRGYVLVAAMSFLVGLAASRVAMLSIVGLVALTVLLSFRRSLKVWSLPLIVFASVALSWQFHHTSGTGQSVVDRGATNGIQDRLTTWGYGLQAWFEHPLFGWGPGRFSIATEGYYGQDFMVRYLGQAYDDAHNVFVELLVSWGVVGLMAFLVFTFAVIKSSSGPMAWAGGAVAMSWLLQPAGPHTLAILGVFFGVASSTRATNVHGGLGRVTTAVLVGLASLASLSIVVGAESDRLATDLSSSKLPSGILAWYRYDWFLASLRASPAPATPSELATKMFWAQRAVELEPEHSGNHMLIAYAARLEGDYETARASAERALELQPSLFVAFVVLRQVALAEGDLPQASDYADRLCSVGAPQYCELVEPKERAASPQASLITAPTPSADANR